MPRTVGTVVNQLHLLELMLTSAAGTAVVELCGFSVPPIVDNHSKKSNKKFYFRRMEQVQFKQIRYVSW